MAQKPQCCPLPLKQDSYPSTARERVLDVGPEEGGVVRKSTHDACQGSLHTEKLRVDRGVPEELADWQAFQAVGGRPVLHHCG